jgi:hypothetical protein
VAALVLAALGVLAIRVVLEGRGALAEGDEAAAHGRIDDAIAGWESAARWYLPFAPHVDDAYARLIQLAATDHRHALAAWRAVRASALATRSLWTPHADDLLAANAAIAELASRDPEGAVAGGADAAARKAWHADRLARDPRPRPGPVVLAALGIACWLAGIAVFVRRGFDADGALARRSALAGAAVTIVGLAGWLIGLAAA